MHKLRRVGVGAIAVTVVFGVALGMFTQFALTAAGKNTLVPPLSIGITFVLLAAALLVLGLRLKRALTQSHREVHALSAVRLLVTAQASQYVSSLFIGVWGGVLLTLLGRSVLPPAAVWAPGVWTIATGCVLLTVAMIVERWCRVPPESGPDGAGSAGDQRHDGPAPSSQGVSPAARNSTEREPKV